MQIDMGHDDNALTATQPCAVLGAFAEKATIPDISTISMSPSESGALLTVISRPSYDTLAPTSKEAPSTLFLFT